MKRFHVVAVSALVGYYRRNDPIAWAVADHERANSIVSRRFTSIADAAVEAERMEREAAA